MMMLGNDWGGERTYLVRGGVGTGAPFRSAGHKKSLPTCVSRRITDLPSAHGPQLLGALLASPIHHYAETPDKIKPFLG